MSLAPLATAADLAARNITEPDGVDVDSILDAASSVIRDAAGSAISLLTSTVKLPVLSRTDALALPAGPVISVATVSINGIALVASTDFVLVGSTLYRLGGYVWADTTTSTTYLQPCEVLVTYTHGYAAIPTDIVDLTCTLASVAFAAIDDGSYGGSRKLAKEGLGDYVQEFQRNVRDAPGAIATPSPLGLPDDTRRILRNRFMGSAFVVDTR